MEFSRQEYGSGLPFPPPVDLPNPGIKPTSLVSPALAGGFFTTSTTQEAPVSYESTAFLGTSCCALYLCVLSNSGVSVFTSPKEFLQSNSDDLQSQVIWGLLCPITKIPGLPFLWENLCGLISFQFASTCKCGFYFIVIVPLLLSHCGFFVFRSRAFWGIGSSFFFFVNSCLAVSHDFSVFVREGELTSFYSTILFSSVQ